MFDLLMDMLDTIKFDVLGMKKPKLPLFDPNMRLELHGEKGGYWVSSKEHPGLVASGDTLEELREATFESILVYYSVPRYHAKRINDLLSLHLSDGTVINPPEPIFSIKVKIA
jgi:predicted RNase H-like HicB family nuclease